MTLIRTKFATPNI